MPLSSSTEPDEPQRTVVLDALPYVEQLHEDYEQYALALIDDELKKQPTSSSMPKQSEPKFRTSLMQTEYEAATNRLGPLVPFTSDSVLEPPVKNGSSVQEWQDAVQKARTAYERERIRSLSLTIAKETATMQHKAYNEMLRARVQEQSQLLERQQQVVEELNLQRQQNQQGTGQKLHVLETQYNDLVQKLFSLRNAVATLEAQFGKKFERETAS